MSDGKQDSEQRERAVRDFQVGARHVSLLMPSLLCVAADFHVYTFLDVM